MIANNIANDITKTIESAHEKRSFLGSFLEALDVLLRNFIVLLEQFTDESYLVPCTMTWLGLGGRFGASSTLVLAATPT